MTKKINIKESLARLEKISEWFQKEKDLDVEEGLAKVKEAAVLVRELKERMKEVENEFEEIKKSLN